MTALRIVMPLLVLVIVWQVADGRAALARIAAADPGWLVLALAGLHGQTVLSALRWRLVSGALGQRLSVARAVREYYVAQIVNQTLPGGVVGDVARVARAAGPSGLRGAATAVIVERAVGQAALLGVLGAALCGSLAFGRMAWPPATAPLLAGGSCAVVVGLALLRRNPDVRHAFAVAVTARPVWPRQVLLGLAIVSLNLAAFAAVARATGTPLTPEAMLTLIPLILTAMLIPLSVAGWGWREGAAAALFPLAGAMPEAGLAASAVYGALMLVAAVPGAWWLAPPAANPPV